jgi:hypothetical protein
MARKTRKLSSKRVFVYKDDKKTNSTIDRWEWSEDDQKMTVVFDNKNLGEVRHESVYTLDEFLEKKDFNKYIEEMFV